MAYARGKGKKKKKKLDQRVSDFFKSNLEGKLGYHKPGSYKK